MTPGKSASPKPHSINPTPATCHTRKTEVSFRKAALQKLRCNICFSAVRTSFFFPKAALQQTKNCTATLKKLQLQESGAFVLLSCRFQAPTSRLPRLGHCMRGQHRHEVMPVSPCWAITWSGCTGDKLRMTFLKVANFTLPGLRCHTLQTCEPIGPVQGSKSSKLGEELARSEKLGLPPY